MNGMNVDLFGSKIVLALKHEIVFKGDLFVSSPPRRGAEKHREIRASPITNSKRESKRNEKQAN